MSIAARANTLKHRGHTGVFALKGGMSLCCAQPAALTDSDTSPFPQQDKTALKCEEGESVHSLWFVGDEGGEPKVSLSQAASRRGVTQQHLIG